MAKKQRKMITVNLRDERHLEMLRLVTEYEAEVRGVSRASALFDLVMEAADTASYPEEVRSELKRIQGERMRDAVASSLSGAEPARSA